MALRRLCKSAGSYGEEDCPALYVDDSDPAMMVGQGPELDDAATGKLLAVGTGEVGIAIPTETVLRAAGLFLAERGHPVVRSEVEAYLAEVGW